MYAGHPTPVPTHAKTDFLLRAIYYRVVPYRNEQFELLRLCRRIGRRARIPDDVCRIHPIGQSKNFLHALGF
jgi:hypothetical protein